MRDYKMSLFTNAEADALSLDGLVNDNALVPTRRNGPKPSYQFLVDGWNAEFAAKIIEINKSRGFRVVGTFAAGFTYELLNDVGIDASGNSWIYTGTNPLPLVVTAGTVPSTPDFQQVTYNDHSGLVNLNVEGGHDAIYARSVNSLKSLVAYTPALVDGQKFDVTGFYANTKIGGGLFIWDASRSKTEHNGGTVIAPEALIAWDGTSGDIATLTGWTGAGVGCFVKLNGNINHEYKITSLQESPSEIFKGTDDIISVDKLAVPKFYGKAGSTKPRLILAGIDSLTAGSGLSSYIHDLRKYCKAQFGDGGAGYFTFDTDVSNNEGPSGANIVNPWFNSGMTLLKSTPIDSEPRIYSLDGGGVTIAAGNGTQSFNWSPKEVWHTAKIFYLRKPGGGTFGYWLNALGASTRVTVDANHTELDLGVLEITTDAWKGNAVTFDQVNGDVTVFGGLFEKNNDGCMVSRSAFGGFRLDTFTQLDPAFQAKWFAALNPSIYLFNGGTNDSTSSLPDAFKVNMTTYLGQIKSSAPDVDIYVINPNDKSNSNAAGQYFNDYIDKRIEVCEEQGYGYIDVRKSLGNYNRAVELGLMNDATHPNSKGNRIIASVVSENLGVEPNFNYAQDDYLFFPLKTTLKNSGELDQKRVVTLTNGNSVNIYKLGLNNGYSTAIVTLRIVSLAASTSRLREWDAKIKVSNQLVEGKATSASVVSVGLITDETSSSHDISISTSIVAGKCQIAITSVAENQNLMVYGRYDYAYNVNRQQGIYQYP